jgi:branched-chain amino acid transport system substrate-binding protein
MKLIQRLFSSFLLALLVAGCKKAEGPAPAADTIKIGEYASLTGREATFGTSSHHGTMMAIDEINAAGGVLGKKLVLITEDTQSKPGEPATVVRKLIFRDKVVAVLGEVASTRSLEAAPVCQQNKIPMISPSSTNPKVTEIGDFIFRVCFIDPFQGTVMADFTAKTLKIKRVAIFTDVKSDYSKGLANFFKERHLANGGSIVAEQDYSGGDKDFKAQLTAIKAAKPEAVFVPGYYTEAGLIAQQARQLDLAVPLMGGDGWESSKLIEIGRDSMEGHYFSTHYAPEVASPLSNAFVENYKKRFKETPDALAANGYDSALLLADAIKRAGAIDGQKIRDALAATKDLEAVSGRITINAQRDADKSAVVLQVKEGRFKYLQTIAP